MTHPVENCPQPETEIRERAWTAEQVEYEACEMARYVNASPTAIAMLRAYAATMRQQTTNPPEIGSKLVGQQADHSFASHEALAEWLESLHETNDDGAITGGKWEPAQVAACAIRSMGQQAKQGGRVDACPNDDAGHELATKHHLFIYEVDFGDEGKGRYIRLGDFNKVVANLEAALEAIAPLLRAPAEKMEAARCPPTYRREEAVKAVTALGWKWDGKAWIAPAPAEKCGRVDLASRAIYARLQSLGRHLDSDICDELAEAALVQIEQGGMMDKAAKHWHGLYRAECRLRQDDAARYGQQIIDMEQAALAQNTQGEALAWAHPQEIAHLAKQNGVANVPMWNCSGDGRVPLYLHAERARVPDAKAMPPLYADESRCDQYGQTRYIAGWNACRDAMLAAAPSKPVARARVPDGYALVPCEAGDQDAFMVYHEYQQPCRTRKDAYRIAIRKLAERAKEQLAAAPSQPEDAGEVDRG